MIPAVLLNYTSAAASIMDGLCVFVCVCVCVMTCVYSSVCVCVCVTNCVCTVCVWF